MFPRMTFATLARLNHAITCVNIIGASKCNISPSWLVCKMTSFQGMWKIIVGGKVYNMKYTWFKISKGHILMIISLLKG